jgi:hypothetical protein
MISSLVRWLRRGAGSGRSGRGAGSARRFTPRLEALEERANPGGVIGSVSSVALLGANVGSPSHVILFGGNLAGIGEEIPQQLAGIGEEIPQT